MEEYSQRIDLYAGEDFTVFQANSSLYKKEVVVKEYQRSDVYSSEGLAKEAIRQAREKPKETAALIGISLEPREGVSGACTVSYVLEKKAQDVARSLIERNDGSSQWALVGLDGYQIRSTVYAVERKRVEIAFSTHLGKEVAIKSKRCSKANEANELLREAFLLAYVEHRNVCKLIDICFTRDEKFSFRINLIMEKLETVGKDMEDRDYQESELLKFLQDVARGLAYMKTLVSIMQNVAHCDIKPSNVFIDENRDYKLGDLGSAWKKSLRTETSFAVGTVYYMSPETRLCSSNPKFRINLYLADVYSLGITAMHMAAQKFPILNDSIKPEEVINFSDELLSHMAEVDPELRAYRSEGRIKQKMIEMLAANNLFGVRLNIMKSAQETIRNIPYSEDLKQLFQDMVKVDPRLRIHLEDLIERVDYILTRSALLPETAIQPAATNIPLSAQEMLPKNHPQLAMVHSRLAAINDESGRLDEAIQFAGEVLSAQQKSGNVFGKAQSFNHLAVMYLKKGCLAEAAKYSKQSLSIMQRSFPEHLHSIAIQCNNLASIYLKMSILEEAEDYSRKSLQIMDSVFPNGHEDLASVYSNLALIFHRNRQLSEAEDFARKALFIKQRTQPANHPSFAVVYNIIASIYVTMGKLTEAEQLYIGAISIQKKSYPEEHPDLSASYSNLALLYSDMNRLSDAAEYANKSLSILKKFYTGSHPDIAASYNNLAVIYYKMGNLPKAVNSAQEGLKALQDNVPQEHPALATSYINYAALCREIGQESEALEYAQKVYDLAENSNPQNFLYMASSLCIQATVHQVKGEYQKAVQYLKQSLDLRLKVLPENHPDIATTYHNLAILECDMKDFN